MKKGLFLALAVASIVSLPLAAGEVSKDVSFALDQWIELKAEDGPVTLHRIRLAKQGGVTKSKFLRPGNSQFLTDVQIQLEYSNDSSKDWEVHIDLSWVDGDGKVIDGYDDTEGLDSESRQDDTTVTLSTLKYGLDRAKKLKIKLEFYQD